nr:NTPase KAP family P-loop domain-containing protein 1-like [Zootoca vivipara]
MNDPEHQALMRDHEVETHQALYCKALAKTLQEIDPPVTVGFYAPWGRNKRRLLDEIENHMPTEGEENGKKYSLLSLIWHMILCYPSSGSEELKGTRYIFIHFDAWEYVGCDHIWAGILTALLDGIEGKNKALFTTFMVLDGQSVRRNKRKKWVFKGWAKFFIPVIIGLVLILLAASMLIKEDHLKSLFGSTALVGAILFIAPFIHVMTKFYYTLKKKLQIEIDRDTLSAKMGFMNFVKEEVETIANFLQFLGWIEKRKILVVLKIINLDRCTQDKVVDVLDAINILLSNKDAPFISILAADPSILVDCIQKEKKSTNGYMYLDRIVSLPFSMPLMTPKDKLRLFNEILKVDYENPAAYSCEENNIKITVVGLEDPSCNEKLSICKHLMNNEYIPGNSAQLKRVVNTVLTILSITKLESEAPWKYKEKIDIREVIDWLVLANCWPCRLSWILQCLDEARYQRKLEESQRREADRQGRNLLWRETEEDGKTLLEIYDDNEPALAKIKNDIQIQKLLELDGDPDLFRSFLVTRSHITAKWARYLANYLISLDLSLKRPFELLRGLNSITAEEEKAGKGTAEEKAASHHPLRRERLCAGNRAMAFPTCLARSPTSRRILHKEAVLRGRNVRGERLCAGHEAMVFSTCLARRPSPRSRLCTGGVFRGRIMRGEKLCAGHQSRAFSTRLARRPSPRSLLHKGGVSEGRIMRGERHCAGHQTMAFPTCLAPPSSLSQTVTLRKAETSEKREEFRNIFLK